MPRCAPSIAQHRFGLREDMPEVHRGSAETGITLAGWVTCWPGAWVRPCWS